MGFSLEVWRHQGGPLPTRNSQRPAMPPAAHSAGGLRPLWIWGSEESGKSLPLWHMCKIKTRHLLAVNGLLWTAIGIKITITGVCRYLQVSRAASLLWMIPLSLVVFAAFYVMFTGVVRKYSARILAMPEEKAGIWRTFSPKGYILIAFMIGLGITLHHIPGIPSGFFSWFYCGLGPGLISAGIRFLLRWYREK